MGSCSSGGPNKFTGMCLVKSGEATKEEDLSRAIGHQALLSNSNSLKRSGHPCDERRADSSPAVGRVVAAPNKDDTTMKPLMGVAARLCSVAPSEADDGSSVRSRHRGDSLNETRRANFSSPVATSNDYDVRRDNDFLFSTFGYNQTLPTNTGALSTSDHSSVAAVSSKDSAGIVTSKGTVTGAASSSIPPNNTAMSEIDSRKQQHRYQGRKASAPIQSYRWPGEYGTCIVPPPNKTVYDAYKSPCAPLHHLPESTWTVYWDDQKASGYYDQHHKPAVETIGGCNGGEKTSPFGLLPSGGLSSASISSSCCHGSCTSSSPSIADSASLFRRRGSGGAKRSSSVSSSCPSSTAELLPSTRRTGDKVNGKAESEKEKERRRNTTSENRQLAASQRFWNLLRSPMEPLNGGNVSGSARKYAPLDSDASSQGEGVANTNTVSNKRCGLDRPT